MNKPTTNSTPVQSRDAADWTPRPATAADRTASEQLLETVGLTREGLDDHFPGGYALVESDGAVVGIAGVEEYGSHGLLRSLAVRSEYRDRGIGESLVRDRIAWSLAIGYEELYLISEVPGFFARFGFRMIDRDHTPDLIKGSVEFAKVCPETAPVMSVPLNAVPAATRDDVREKYGSIARRFKENDTQASCCAPVEDTSTSCGCGEDELVNQITSNLYSSAELAEVPELSAAASLGCGNPTALAELNPGETVLDLGSGGGIDVLLSARRVGPEGKAYGVDMTDEMLELARENQRKAGVDNVEFLKGEIENVPLPDDSVDVIISNCVINLSTDNPTELREAFRVLKPGGRFAVSDVVARGPVPEAIRKDAELWTGCIAGTLEEKEYARMLAEVGFESVEVVPTRIYKTRELRGYKSGLDDDLVEETDGTFMSAFIRAKKPA